MENMDDYFATVQQRPSARRPTLLAQRRGPLTREDPVHLISDGLDHAFVAPTAQHKNVAQRNVFGNVECEDVAG